MTDNVTLERMSDGRDYCRRHWISKEDCPIQPKDPDHPSTG